MKITWFGGTTFRIQIGGQILVIDAQSAPEGIDRNELVSGADHVVTLGDRHSEADAADWKRRPAERLLDEGDSQRPVQFWSVGRTGLLIDGDDDMPLLLLGSGNPALGRWAEKAVIILAGEQLAGRGTALLGGDRPRLMALAGSEAEIGAAIDAVRDLLDGTALLALEPGLAVES
ncbi:hypothetical protein [Devosia sp. CAU 1758]